MNDLIVRKIKEARLERGLTQKDIANHLGKTAATISDLERGKVQVSANDLFIISQILKKPIEYFFGEELGGKDTEDLLALMRIQPTDVRYASTLSTSMLLKLFELGNKIKIIPEGKEIPSDLISEFLNIFITFSQTINSMTNQLNDIRDKLIEQMKIKGIDIVK